MPCYSTTANGCFSGFHCGGLFTCVQPFFFGKIEECDRPAIVHENVQPKLIEYFLAYVKARNDDDTWGDRLAGVTGRMSFSSGDEPGSAIGSFFPGDQSAYGPQLDISSGVTCKSTHGIINTKKCVDPVSHIQAGEMPCKKTIGHANPKKPEEGLVDLFGNRLGYISSGPCDPDDPEGLYAVNIFGTECKYCPLFLWSMGDPCFDCSWDHTFIPAAASCPHFNCAAPSNCGFDPTTISDSPECEARFEDNKVNRDLGLFNPNWHFACDSNAAGDPRPGGHHCLSCLQKRLRGRLVNEVLRETQALTRIPMFPMENLGCGEFGWEMKSPLTLNPNDCTESRGGQEKNAAVILNKVMREEESLLAQAGGGLCGHLRLSHCDFCGAVSGFGCCNVADLACIEAFTTQFAGGHIDSASLRFTQEELCNPIGGPCDSHPCNFREGRDPCDPELNIGSPLQSEVIMRVVGRIRISMLTRDIIPFSGGECRCCDATPFVAGPTIRLSGDIDVTMPWGDLNPSWFGYRASGTLAEAFYVDSGWQGNINHSCGGTDPTGPSSLGLCMSPFVNHGKYNDVFFDNDPLKNEPLMGVPPKQCPSHIIREGQGDQFFCPPLVRWTWNQGNKVDFAAQCWDVEAVRNRHSCIDNDSDDGNSRRYECTQMHCRRGCKVGNPFRDLRCSPDCRTRTQPCRDAFAIGCTPAAIEAIPYSCGQCIL